MNRAKLAAQSSFAELATLRSNLNDTILSSSSHLKSFSKLPIQSNLIEPSGLLRNEKNGNQLENLTASVTSSVFISGLYLSSPGRGRTLDSTTDILQGSVIIAEADALLTEFRDSFSISTSISTFIPPSNSLSIPISRIAHSQNLNRDKEKKNYGVTSSGRRSIQTRTTQNNDSSDGNNISASTYGLTDSHMSEVEVEVEDGDESSTTQSPRAKKADSLDEMEMINFLEKYSDRLVEMVSNKVIAKTQALNEK